MTQLVRQSVNSLLVFVFIYASTANANISGVMGPNIKEGDRSLQFRSAVSFADEDGEEDAWAYRLHYQHAFNDTWRGRVFLQYRDRGNFEWDSVRTELLYNFKKTSPNDNWSSALRFDLRTRRGSRSEDFAINWGNQWDLTEGFRARAMLVLGKQLGSSRTSNDLAVQSRASVSRKLENGLRVGVHLLNQHGELGNFASVNEQGVFFGPTISGSFGDVNYELRYLNGVTDASADHNLFFRITTSL
ncbi:hypothetical protein ISG33_13955 [Glaciecola sp. MH2013]|uniref:hypothetical protein n=1 Tax=Glaciecola sp. MH2013 TaxID=2785524 RepID=UPI00189F5906|nr:hypothetical protein [Glaciecola sp. MH2013]MBF7074506.1 hypothetical protein [Glaciecola sp. MH2013]